MSVTSNGSTESPPLAKYRSGQREKIHEEAPVRKICSCRLVFSDAGQLFILQSYPTECCRLQLRRRQKPERTTPVKYFARYGATTTVFYFAHTNPRKPQQ